MARIIVKAHKVSSLKEQHPALPDRDGSLFRNSFYRTTAYSFLGHDVRLIPAQYVKPFLKGHKDDYRDAEAIAEAVQRPPMHFVSIKTSEQMEKLI